MYKIIENGIEKMVSTEEAERIVTEYSKRNGLFSIDEMWRTQEVIYLNDSYKSPLNKELRQKH